MSLINPVRKTLSFNFYIFVGQVAFTLTIVYKNNLFLLGPIGVAAAAAIASSKKRKHPHHFETNPSKRKRQQTRLLRYSSYLYIPSTYKNLIFLSGDLGNVPGFYNKSVNCSKFCPRLCENMNYNTCDEYLSLSQFLEIQYE